MNNYLAWVGNTSTTVGQPNAKTGFFSLHGDLVAFATKTERDEYCDTFNHKFNTCPVKTNRSGARKYHLGMSVSDYNYLLDTMIEGF
ncbi:MAG: hypothetical protein ACPGF7_09610 [Pontibacterium sp.]